MKKLIGILFCFGLGFGTHMYLVKDKIPPMDAGAIIKKSVFGTSTPQADNFITYIDFDGEKFSQTNVNIILGNYLAITNQSKVKQMQLNSDSDLLNTPRGYAEGERLMVLMPTKGIFRVVANADAKNSMMVSVE